MEHLGDLGRVVWISQPSCPIFLPPVFGHLFAGTCFRSQGAVSHKYRRRQHLARRPPTTQPLGCSSLPVTVGKRVSVPQFFEPGLQPNHHHPPGPGHGIYTTPNSLQTLWQNTEPTWLGYDHLELRSLEAPQSSGLGEKGKQVCQSLAVCGVTQTFPPKNSAFLDCLMPELPPLPTYHQVLMSGSEESRVRAVGPGLAAKGQKRGLFWWGSRDSVDLGSRYRTEFQESSSHPCRTCIQPTCGDANRCVEENGWRRMHPGWSLPPDDSFQPTPRLLRTATAGHRWHNRSQ